MSLGRTLLFSTLLIVGPVAPLGCSLSERSHQVAPSTQNQESKNWIDRKGSPAAEGSDFSEADVIDALRAAGFDVREPDGEYPPPRPLFGPDSSWTTVRIGADSVSLISFGDARHAKEFESKIPSDESVAPEISPDTSFDDVVWPTEFGEPISFHRRGAVMTYHAAQQLADDPTRLSQRIDAVLDRVMGPMVMGYGYQRDAELILDQLIRDIRVSGTPVTRKRTDPPGFMGGGAIEESLDAGPVNMTAFSFKRAETAGTVARAIGPAGSYIPQVSKGGRLLGGSTYDLLGPSHLYRNGPLIVWLVETDTRGKSKAVRERLIQQVEDIMGEQFAGN